MKNYEPKPLNAFQKQRAPHAVSDESFADLKERMADEGIGHQVFTANNSETGSKSQTWFDRKSGKWKMRIQFADDSYDTLEADSRDDLLAAITAGHAQTVIEAQEAELEANPVFESEREAVVDDWLKRCKFGKECDALCSLLPEDDAVEITNLVKERARKLFGRGAFADIRNLERAYIEVLDSGLLDEFENEAAKIKKQREVESIKNAERDSLAEDLQRCSEDGYTRAMSEYEQEETAKRVAEEKKLVKTKKGLATLRHRALFGDKTNAFPISTGTGKRS